MVIESVERPSDEQLSALEEVDPNELGHHRHFGHTAPDLQFMETASSAEVVGSALTVRIPPVDGTMVHKATELAGPNDVIVIEMDGHETNAPWGEVTTHAAVANDVCGVVIGGAVTDTAAIREIDFPVFARAKTTRTVQRLNESLGGDINVPVQVGGSVVRPGDVAIGNEDGVVFVPQDEIEHVLEHYAGHSEMEDEVIDRLYEGESLADISDANDRIDDLATE